MDAVSAHVTDPAFEARIRAAEEEALAPVATRSYPAERERPEDDCGLRTPFQRDRDRVVHCKAFRRLKHKTQVFVAPEGDHYRTRLTHTLETTQISRTVARALRLNEDLTEAIGLGHDLGHPPFGHIGDELRAGVIAPADLPRDEIEILGATGSERIDTLVHDLVEHSWAAQDIVQGAVVGAAMLRLRQFMFEHVYLGPIARAEHARIERVLQGLFDWYCERPGELPAGVEGASDADRVTDYLAGMTDRFAIRAWTERFVPHGLAS